MYPIIKRNCRLPVLNLYLVILGAGYCLLNGCIIREEGCLDFAASNFDLQAEKACPSCCEYPVLSLFLNQKWNDKAFNTDSVYTDHAGNPFRIHDMRYLLSSFVWSGGEGAFSAEPAEIDCGNSTVSYSPDLLLIEPKKFLYPIDSTRSHPVISEVQFKTGWNPELSCVDANRTDIPALFTDQSILWDPALSSRAAVFLVVERDTSLDILDTFYIHTCIAHELGYEGEFVPGTNTQFEITVNYASWFQDVLVAEPASFMVSILENIPGSFTRTP